MRQRKKPGPQKIPDASPQLLKKIKNLEIQLEGVLNNLDKFQEKGTKLQREIRKSRIIKMPDGTWNIICYCNRQYSTSVNPDARLNSERPQCGVCGKRLEEKI